MKKVALSILRFIIYPFAVCWSAIFPSEIQEPRLPKFNHPAPPELIARYVGATYENIFSSTGRLYDEVADYPCDGTEIRVSGDALRKMLNEENYAIVCAGPYYRGQGKRLSSRDISVCEQRMETYFGARKIDFIRAVGRYQGSGILNSYIVPNSNRDEMIALAQSFLQKAIIVAERGSAAMVDFHTGQSWPASSWSEVPQAADNYTGVQAVDGVFKFTINFNWNSPSTVE